MKLSNDNRIRVYHAQEFEFIFKQRVFFERDPIDAGRGLFVEAIPVLSGDVVLNSWVNIIRAAASRATIDVGYGAIPNYWGNGLFIDTVGPAKTTIHAAKTHNFDQLAKRGSDVFEVEVEGAAYGDQVIVLPANDILGMILTGNVLSHDRVEITMTNLTGDNVLNPASGEFQVIINKAPMAAFPWIVTESDTIDVKATIDTRDVDVDSGIIDVYARIIRI